jgi:protein TonB
MPRAPLPFCLAVSLAAHLAIFAWPVAEQTVGGGRRPLPVHLIMPVPVPLTPALSPVSPPAAIAHPSPPSPAPSTARQPAITPDATNIAAPPPIATPPRSAPVAVATPHPSPAEQPPTPPLAATGPSPAQAVPADPPASPLAAPVDGGEIATAAEIAVPTLVQAQPLYAENPPPAYPRLARQRGWQGEVLLQVRVGSSGQVLAARVERSTGYPVLDRAALQAVLDWHFQPARRGPLAVESEVRVPVRFRLERG